MEKEFSDELFDTLCQAADTVLYVEEKSTYESYKESIIECAKANRDAFFTQVDEKISECDTEVDKSYVRDSTSLFLLISIRKLIEDHPLENEKLDIFADYVNKMILSYKKDV